MLPRRLLLKLVASPRGASSATRGGAALASARATGDGVAVDAAADAERGGAGAADTAAAATLAAPVPLGLRWRRHRLTPRGDAADGPDGSAGAANAAAPVLLHVAREPSAPPVPRAVIGTGGGVKDGHADTAAAAVETVATQAAAALPRAAEAPPSSSTPPSPVEAVTAAPVRPSPGGLGSAEDARSGGDSLVGDALDDAWCDGGSAAPPTWGGWRRPLIARVRDVGGSLALSGPPVMPRAPLENSKLVEVTFDSGESAAASAAQAARPAEPFAWRPASSSSSLLRTPTGSRGLHRMFSSSAPPPPGKVTLDSSASVAALAEALAAALRVSPAHFIMTRLAGDGKVVVGLDDPTATLAAAGLTTGATIDVSLRDALPAAAAPPERKPLKIIGTLKQAGAAGARAEVTVDSSASVAALAQELAAALRVSSARVVLERLADDGKVVVALDDLTATLAAAGLTTGATVDVSLREVPDPPTPPRPSALQDVRMAARRGAGALLRRAPNAEDFIVDVVGAVQGKAPTKPGRSLYVFGGIACVLAGTTYYVWRTESEAGIVRSMCEAFASGSGWDAAMFADNDKQAKVERKKLAADLSAILHPTSTATYGVIVGASGTGKSTAVRRALSDLPSPKGAIYFYAPAVIASYSKGLAAAVGYRRPLDLYDRVRRFFTGETAEVPQASPSTEEPSATWIRLEPLLYKAAVQYKATNGRPAALVLDAMDLVAKRDPALFTMIQDFAKRCADAGILRVVLVFSDGAALPLLSSSSAITRAPTIYEVGDIPDDDAVKHLMERYKKNEAEAKEYVTTVAGGRFSLLMKFGESSASVEEIRLQLDERTGVNLDAAMVAPTHPLFRALLNSAAGSVGLLTAQTMLGAPALTALLRVNILAQHPNETVTFENRHVKAYVADRLSRRRWFGVQF